MLTRRDLELRLTPAAVSEMLHVSYARVLEWIRDGDLVAIDIGRGSRPLWRIHPDDLVRFEAARKKLRGDHASQ